jgi:hypothetical protein
VKKLFAVVSIVAVGGCSLFGFDGLSGGADPPIDAGSDGTTSSDSPTTIDGDADDAGGGDDATPSGPFCKTVGADASVCDDFEEPGTFTGKWPAKDTYLGTLTVVDGAGIAASRGLHFEATPKADGQPGQDGRVVLGWTSPSTASYVDAELAVKLTSVPPTTYAAGPLYIEFERDDGGRARVGFLLDGEHAIAVNPTVFYADGGVVGSGGKVLNTLPIGSYARIRLVVDLSKSPNAIVAYVDGKLVHEQTIIEFVPAKVNVFIGAHYVGTADGGTLAMDLDDARINWR